MVYYYLTITDSTRRSYSIHDSNRPYTVNQLIRIDEPGDHDLMIKQYVWNTYGLTSNHLSACRHCDPRDNCWSGTCDLHMYYVPIDPTGAVIVSQSGLTPVPALPSVKLPDNWPDRSSPRTMFAEGKITYR